MFWSKATKINKLQEIIRSSTADIERLVDYNRRDTLKIQELSNKFNDSQQDIETWSKRWRELGDRFEALSKENRKLKAGIRDSRNKDAHYVVELNKLATKITGHKHDLTENFDL